MNGLLNRIVDKMDISSFLFHRSHTEQKPSFFRELIETPERFKLEATIEDDELRIFVKRKE